MKTCWNILGIDITLDKKLIKKSYALLLRTYHPQKDPEGFQRLKQAYDEALNLASTLTIK
ncbi:hypothetical protein MNBD_GAMMA10-3076, partial [hydrothermal vent metagenome]